MKVTPERFVALGTSFRRFVGTQLARKNLRMAQKALGHKRLETTARHYILDELEPGLTDDLY